MPTATTALDALCEILRVNLVIKRKNAHGMLKTVHTHVVDDAPTTHILLHTRAGRLGGAYNAQDPHGLYLNHFNRLYRASEIEQSVRASLRQDLPVSRSDVVSRPTPKAPGEIGKITFAADTVVNQNTQTNALITFQTHNLIQQEIQEESHTKTSNRGLCDPSVQLMVTLAAGIATSGLGAAAMSSLGVTGALTTAGLPALSVAANAAASAIASRGLVSIINNAGDPGAVFKSMTSSDALRSYLIEGIAAGAIQGISDKFNIPMAPSMDAGNRAAEASTLVDASQQVAEASMLTNFGDHLRAQLIRNGVRAPLNFAIGGQDLDEALENAIRAVEGDTVGGFMAGEIGVQYKQELIDGATHKILHALSGAATGAIFNSDPLKGAISGAVAAVVVESIVEIMAPDQTTIGQRIVEGEDPKVIQKELEKIADMGRVGAAVTALILDQDVGTAIRVSTLTVENNFLPVVAWTAAKVLWEVYVLTHPDEVEAAKESICQYISDKTGLPVELVRTLGETIMTASSVGSAVRQGVKKVTQKAAREVIRDQAHEVLALPRPTKDGHLVPTPSQNQVSLPSYWNKTIEYKGNKVYQRDDLIDPNFINSDGLNLTNLQRMKLGKAPYGFNNEKIELHHMLQTQNGPIAEINSKFHKENYYIIHINPNTIPSGINQSIHS